MEKVRKEGKKGLDGAGNGQPKRKKRKKDLDELRQNVFEARRSLRQKAAPPKTRKSAFTKALNQFADKRQENLLLEREHLTNSGVETIESHSALAAKKLDAQCKYRDDKTQGVDSKGRKTGRKTICSRLLPEQKPRRQVGIFANGSKGAEIKRATLPLDRGNRARLQGDINKLLDDNTYQSKKTLPDELDNILRRPSTEDSNADDPLPIQNEGSKVSHEFGQSPLLGRQTRSKRKLADTINEPGKKIKKPELKIVLQKIVTQNAKATRTELVQKEEKCKRRLFEDDVTDFNPIDEIDVEEIRFSPNVAETNISKDSSPKCVAGKEEEFKKKVENQTLNFSSFGWAPATRYEELCAMICTENFEDCLQDIPYVDPLKNVTKALRSLFADTCHQHHLRQKFKAAERAEVQSSDSDSCVVLSDNNNKTLPKLGNHPYRNIQQFTHRAKRFHRSECSSGSINLQTSKRSSYVDPKRQVTKEELKKRSECATKEGTSTSSCNEDNNTDSVGVNYVFKNSKIRAESSRERPFELAGNPKPVSLQSASSSMFHNIESGRDMLMFRYLENVNNSKPAKEIRSMFPPEVFAPPSEKSGPKRYLGDPLRRHQITGNVAKSSERNARHIPAILRRSNNSSTVKTGNSTASAELMDLGIFSGHSQLKASTVRPSKMTVDRSRSDITSCGMFKKIPSAANTKITIPEILEQSEKPMDPNLRDQQPNPKCVLLTPCVTSSMYHHNDQILRAKQNFMNAKYKKSYRSEPCDITVDKKKDLLHPKVVMFRNNIPPTMREHSVQFPTVYCPMNFDRDAIRSFQDQWNSERPAKSDRTMESDAKSAPKPLAFDEQNFNRRPIFLQQQSAPQSPDNARQDARKFQHPSQQVFLQDGEPKVIIVQNPAPQNNDQLTHQHGFQNEQNRSGLVFLGRHRNVQMIPEVTVYDHTRGVQQLPNIQVSDIHYRNSEQLVGNAQRAGTVFGDTAHGTQKRGVPKIVCQNGIHELQRIRDTGVVYSMDSSGVSKVEQSSRAAFHNGVARNNQQGRAVLKGQASLERQNSGPRRVKLPDGHIGIFVPKNDACQHFANAPSTSQQAVLNKYSTVYVEDKSDFNFILDPAYPQAGYKRNQVEGISQQDYQRVIQPVYNISDAYLPQVAPNYFAHEFLSEQ